MWNQQLRNLEAENDKNIARESELAKEVATEKPSGPPSGHHHHHT